MNISKNKESGQSVVEFVLIAPILFFIFFLIIQLFYIAYVSLAIQRATYSIAQQAAASSNPTSFQPQFQLLEALLPLEKLNPSTLVYTLATKCSIATDGGIVNVKVSYPMPLWVPIVKNIIGQPLDTSTAITNFIPPALSSVLQTVGLPLPNLSISQSPAKVLWINFEATTTDENSIGNT